MTSMPNNAEMDDLVPAMECLLESSAARWQSLQTRDAGVNRLELRLDRTARPEI